MSASPPTIIIVRTATTREKRKKLLPSRRYSFQGRAIAARFLTTQSVKMKRPRALTHISTTAIATMKIQNVTIKGTTQHWNESDEEPLVWMNESRSQCCFD